MTSPLRRAVAARAPRTAKSRALIPLAIAAVAVGLTGCTGPAAPTATVTTTVTATVTATPEPVEPGMDSAIGRAEAWSICYAWTMSAADVELYDVAAYDDSMIEEADGGGYTVSIGMAPRDGGWGVISQCTVSGTLGAPTTTFRQFDTG